MIIINDYNPAWPAEFEAIRLSLSEILGPLALRIDRIGSTSVPGLGAKDVIDIQITVEALMPEVRQRLIEAGYECWGAIAQDHVPLGADDDPQLWAKFFSISPRGSVVRMCMFGSRATPTNATPCCFVTICALTRILLGQSN